MGERFGMSEANSIGGYEPRFDFKVDLAYGHEGEANLLSFIASLNTSKVEVKADRYRNGRMVVETAQKPAGSDWKPSGINVTESEWWAYRFAPDAFVLVSVERLKNYLRANRGTLEKRGMASDGDNPAEGFLLFPHHVQDLLTNEKYDPNC